MLSVRTKLLVMCNLNGLQYSKL